MSKKEELKAFARDLSDSARKVIVANGKAVIPLKLSEENEILNEKNFEASKHVKMLNLDELRFLKVWRDSGWDEEAACKKSMVDYDKAKRMVRKLLAFKREDQYIKALADIPTPEYIQAKHVENVGTGKLDDSQRDSLKELAKITGAYKNTTNLTLTQNVFNLPKLTPEIESQFKELAEKALEVEAEEERAA